MTRVIHTGDTHIGYKQYHSPARRQDFLDAFEAVVDDAVGADVDAVVHAGDLFHDRRPDLRDILGTLSALRELDAAGIPFLAVVGNHEATRGGQWLDLFERLGLARRLGDAPIVVGDTAFYGLDHVPRSQRADLEYDFEPHDAAHAVLVSHGLFTPFAHADWDTETVLESATVAFDAVLLGDNHTPDTAQVNDTWVTYCGSTERASASERDARGYNIVEFDDGVDIRRRSLDTRPFVFVSVALGPDEGGERVREQVRQHDLADAVVIVEITGEGDPVTPASVEELAVDEGALIARVTDRRELESESELEVSFADPDAAVRERVADLGLSSAALEVDGTVRAGDVADSNVRETVRDRVAALIDDDLDAFEGLSPEQAKAAVAADARPADAEPDTPTGADEQDGESTTVGDDEDGESTAVGDDEDGESTTAEENADEEPATADADEDVTTEATADDEAAEATSDDEATEATSDDDAAEAMSDDDAAADVEDVAESERRDADETDGQVSMEDFL